MRDARAWQPLPAAIPAGPRGRPSDRRILRRVAALLCLLLALYCLVAGAITLAQPSAWAEIRSPETPRDRLPLFIPLIFLVFLVVTAAVARRGGPPAAGPPVSPARDIDPR